MENYEYNSNEEQQQPNLLPSLTSDQDSSQHYLSSTPSELEDLDLDLNLDTQQEQTEY